MPIANPTVTRYLRGYACCLLCLTALPLWAQDSTKVDPTQEKQVVITPEDAKNPQDTVTYAAANDQAPVQVRSVDTDLREKLQNSREYRYGDDVPPTASLWDQFWGWFWMKVGELLRTRAYRSVGQYMLMLVIAGLVIWLLYKAEVLNRLFPGRARNLGLDYTTLEEDIHAINFTDRIDEAVRGRNYRLAVRLLYLQTLKRLTDNGLIRWQPNKTNRQYAYELTGNPARLGFEQLTTHFEYVWYGDFPVDETRFTRIQEEFKAFNS